VRLLIKVTLLGTSGSTPTKTRGMPSVAITYNGRIYLFDCGEGTQMKMLSYGLNISRIESIFITHAHGDHIIGLAGLIRTLSANNREKPLVIHVPKGYEKPIVSLIVFDRAQINYPIAVKGVRTGTVYRGKGFSISAFRVNHQILTYSYAFKEDDKRRFMKEKCKKLGIKGPIFSVLQSKKRIRLDSRTITLNSVTTLQKGKKVVYSVDTRPTAAAVRASKDAELLIHEAVYTSDKKRFAVQRKHSTAYEAARVARQAHVKRLVLTHISARYKDARALLSEARKVFKNTTVANDGDSITV
jgi:ribonuclease Z